MNDLDFRFLADMTTRIASAHAAQRERDDRIASLIRYRQASVTEIMSVTGLTKSRVYQIFENKYGTTVRAMAATEERAGSS